jgi:hypothetical protein
MENRIERGLRSNSTRDFQERTVSKKVRGDRTLVFDCRDSFDLAIRTSPFEFRIQSLNPESDLEHLPLNDFPGSNKNRSCNQADSETIITRSVKSRRRANHPVRVPPRYGHTHGQS